MGAMHSYGAHETAVVPKPGLMPSTHMASRINHVASFVGGMITLSVHWTCCRPVTHACADMGMTYSVIVQCTDCVVFPRRVRARVYG